MLRKVLIFLTILLIAFLGYFSYKLLKQKEVAVNSLIDAIPIDASVIIEINRPELIFDFIYAPPIDAQTFLNIPFIREPLEKLHNIDSLAKQDKVVKAALRRPHSAIISGHVVGKDELETIFYLKLNTEKEFNSIDKLIRQSTKAKGNISQHNYEDVKIYDVSLFNRNSGGFSYAYYRGMLVASKSSILVEEVIRQTGSNTSIRNKTGLETVLKTAGKSSPFNIYINFDYFPSLASGLIHQRFRPELNAIGNFAHWIELDCNIEKDAIILNGFSSSENTNGFLSDIFKDQEPLKLTLPGLLPAGTKSFLALGITDYNHFRNNFAKYQQKNLSGADFDRNLINFRKSTGIDLESEFAKIFDSEVCFSYYSGSTSILEKNVFTVIRTKGNSETQEFISQLTSAAKNSKADSSGIYNLKAYNIPQLLFGNVFGLNKNSYCTINDNYLIFGDSIPLLQAYAKEFSQLKNLSSDFNYRKLAELLSEDTYCYFYLSPDAEQFYRYYMKYTSDQIFSQYKYGLSQVQTIVYQFGRNNNLFYNNAFVQFSPKPKGNITKHWEVQLENPLSSKIQLVKNHSSQKSEIVLQDNSNNLYLISTEGQILWKRKFNSKILGEVYQADLFLNKKLQLIFNTADQIFAIDRNGKDVEGFPIKLQKKATGPLAIYDYDKNRNYRIFIPLSDNKLYCLDKKGKEIEGWNKPSISGNLHLKYYSNSGKDYIVVADQNGIHFLDRKGKSRIETTQKVKVGMNSEIYCNSSKNTFNFITSDSTGSINLIALNGNVTKIQTGIYPENHYYFFEDLNSDDEKDHLFFYDHKFEAFTNSGDRLMNFPLKSEITIPPSLLLLSDSTYIFSYTDTYNNKIFLNKNNGNGFETNTLAGNSEVIYQTLNNPDSATNIYYCNNNILICISVK